MNNLGWSDTSSDAILCMTFCTGCSLADLTSTDTIRHCADRGFAKTMPMHTQCVVCYSRTNAGSEAVYVCDEGFQQNGAATRVCQSDGVCNGSILQCMPNLENQGTTSVSVHYCSRKVINWQPLPTLSC